MEITRHESRRKVEVIKVQNGFVIEFYTDKGNGCSQETFICSKLHDIPPLLLTLFEDKEE